MAYCTTCGTQTADYATNCPNCGAPMVQQQAQNPYGGNPYGQQQPYGQPYAQPYGTPYPQQPAPNPTSAGMWFLWYLLCGVLPIIGSIILMNASSADQSTKNFGKCMLIMQIVAMAASALIFFLFFAFIGTMSRY